MNRAYEILLTGEGESVILVEYAVMKTAGTFKCVAENSEGSISFETQLIVHRKYLLLHTSLGNVFYPSIEFSLNENF